MLAVPRLFRSRPRLPRPGLLAVAGLVVIGRLVGALRWLLPVLALRRLLPVLILTVLALTVLRLPVLALLAISRRDVADLSWLLTWPGLTGPSLLAVLRLARLLPVGRLPLPLPGAWLVHRRTLVRCGRLAVFWPVRPARAGRTALLRLAIVGSAWRCFGHRCLLDRCRLGATPSKAGFRPLAARPILAQTLVMRGTGWIAQRADGVARKVSIVARIPSRVR